ncbi:MAG: hypothetical protein KF757_13355 [Phycisphaeraceae bacterium]|nr:hypothetical protein [Phycisphaeraceae bacterium]MCW5763949.1 hypothetical protein [Phycisphaeraceae bacterium]
MRGVKLMAGLCVSGSIAHAQLHAGDIVIGLEDQRITTAAQVSGVVELDRVFTGLFGAEGFADFTNNPGFDSFAGTWASGTVIGFDIVGAVKRWAPDASHFYSTANERISIRKGGLRTDSPLDDVTVAGFAFGDANTSGTFHHHVNFWLIDGETPNADGVWLLGLRLWSETAAIQDSEEFWIVYGQGTHEVFMDEAVQWVRDHLIGEPCPADFNGDGILDFFDVSAFLAAFSAQHASADMNGDGVFDFFDVQMFLGAFAAGCP